MFYGKEASVSKIEKTMIFKSSMEVQFTESKKLEMIATDEYCRAIVEK